MRQITSTNSQSPDSVPQPRHYHSELSGEPGTTTLSKIVSRGTEKLLPYDCRHGPLTVCFRLPLIQYTYSALQCLQMTFRERIVKENSAGIAQVVKKKFDFVYIAFYCLSLRKWFCSSRSFTFASQIQYKFLLLLTGACLPSHAYAA